MSEFKFNRDNFLGGGLLLFAGAAFLLIQSGIAIIASAGQSNWLTVEAVVTQARITRTSGDRPQTFYHFEYAYQVNGQDYRSYRYSLSNAGGDKTKGVKRFNEGERIAIHYNPDNPALAVVEKGRAGIFVYLAGAFGLLLGVMAIGLTFAGDVTGLFALFARNSRNGYADE